MLVCACRTRSTDHQRVQRYAPFHSTAICARLGIRDSLWMFFAYKKMLGRTEMRTRDRMYCQTIRSVWDISRGDRARIATCSLRTSSDRLTDRLKANYSIDVRLCKVVNYISNSYQRRLFTSKWGNLWKWIPKPVLLSWVAVTWVANWNDLWLRLRIARLGLDWTDWEA